ncbi:MAG: glycosyltransferase family 39 protein, partial [Cytophagales bacterium]|nr:glycosyltransferase family 39 protein [Cytophagales bacterium]
MLSFHRSISKHEGKLTLSYVGLYLASLVFIIGLNHDFWTDEGHFYRTILLFISKPSLHTLAHYEEMSTPLPFILYALWGKLVGIEISSLRLFSLILSASTFFCLHYLISVSFPGMKIRALVAVISFSLIPYVPGLSFFVYTDMPAILFMLLAWICLIKNQPIPLFFFASASVWSRQYLVFFIAAGLVYSFLMAFNDAERKKSISLGVSLLLAMASLLPLAIIWGGLSPDNEVKNQYLVTTTRYNFHALQAYLYSISLFSLPVLLPIIPFLVRNKGIVISSLAASFTYWLFPVQTSEASMQLGYFHVGFFHKFLSKILL